MSRKDSNISIDDLDMNTHEGNNQEASNSSLKDIIGPLIDEVKALRESFRTDYNKLDKKLETAIGLQKDEFIKLEASIAMQRAEVAHTPLFFLFLSHKSTTLLMKTIPLVICQLRQVS